MAADVVSPDRIDAYLRRKRSPLAGLGQKFVEVGDKYGIDPSLLVAIAGAESGFGKQNSGSNNPFGWGPGIDFPSFDVAIEKVGRGLRRGYLDQGRTTVDAIGAKWAPAGAANDPTGLNRNWAGNVSQLLEDLTGVAPAQLGAAARGGIASGAAAPAGGGIDSVLAELLTKRAPEPDRGPRRSRLLPLLDELTSAPAAPAGAPAAAAARSAVGGLVLPLGTPLTGGSEFGVSDPEGAPSARGGRYHAGKDWFAPAGAPVVAPVAGRVVEAKPSRGNSGQVFGGTVKVMDEAGRVFVFRHVDPRGVRVGQTVQPGTPIAAVSAWRDGSPHAHIEVWRTLEGGYRLENMLDPVSVFRRP